MLLNIDFPAKIRYHFRMLTPMLGNQKLAFANTLRGIAALSVVMSHYFGVFWKARDVTAGLINAPRLPDAITTPTIVHIINYFPLFSWGAFGVALFFLISGFVIPFSFRTYNRWGFAVGRILRIWPTYIIGFSITLLAILYASHFFHRPFPYPTNQVIVGYFPGIRDLLFYPSIDGIVWTLEIEVKFYLLCVLIASMLKKGLLSTFLIPLFLFASAYLINITGYVNPVNHSHYFFNYSFISQFIVYMFIGTLFNFYYQNFIDKKKLWLLLTMLYILFIVLLHTGPSSTLAVEPISCSLAMLLFMFAFFMPSWFKGNLWLNKLADISYPLYVVHGVTGYVCLRLLLNFNIHAWLAWLITLTCIFTIASLLHRFVEVPSNQLGKTLAKKLQSFSLSIKIFNKFVVFLKMLAESKKPVVSLDSEKT